MIVSKTHFLSNILCEVVMGNCCASDLRAAIRDENIPTLTAILDSAGARSGEFIDEDTDADCCLDWMDCNRKPRSPLFTAVNQGNLDIVRILVEYGADTSSTDDMGHNLFHLAAKSNNLEIARYLNDVNRDLVDCRDNDGLLPVHVACCGINSIARKNIAVLKLIIEETKNGKNGPKETDNFGYTPIDYAVKFKHEVAIEYLKNM
jgi:hypothetical protein